MAAEGGAIGTVEMTEEEAIQLAKAALARAKIDHEEVIQTVFNTAEGMRELFRLGGVPIQEPIYDSWGVTFAPPGGFTNEPGTSILVSVESNGETFLMDIVSKQEI